MSADAALREDIVQACRGMISAGLTRGTSGNVSARAADGMIITPSAVPFDELEPEQLLFVPLALDTVDPDTVEFDTASGLRFSTEWRLHAAILRARPEIGAVLHAHPPYGTALACLRRDIPAFHYMIAVAGGADIRCADYATFGTPDLAACAVAALVDRTACLLANHGTVALGDTPAHALDRAIEVEALAEMYCHALAAGEPVLLGDAEIAAVMQAFRGYGRARRD
jgi:L-fuculose-phosphate aldolase